MSHLGKAIVRELIEDIEGVSHTWFELEIEGSSRKKTLVVEVNFEVDPNSAEHLRSACDQIENTFKAVLREENGDQISKLKIVNKPKQSGEISRGDKPSKRAPNDTPTAQH